MDFQIGVQEVCGLLAFGGELCIHIVSGVVGIVNTDSKIVNIADIGHYGLKGLNRIETYCVAYM